MKHIWISYSLGIPKNKPHNTHTLAIMQQVNIYVYYITKHKHMHTHTHA